MIYDNIHLVKIKEGVIFMSVENVKKFLERVESNKNLSQKLEKAKNELNSIDTNLKNYENIINTKIIPIAKEAGFDFTAKDFLEYASEIFSELDEKDLLNVSGGSLPKKRLVGLTFLLAFAPFAPNFIAGAEVKTQQSSQSPQSNHSAQRKNSSEFNKFKPSKMKSFAPTIFGGKSIEEQEKDNLVNYLKENNITSIAQVPEQDLEWVNEAVKSTGKRLTENTINGTYYLKGTIPDENQTNELNLIHKWYVAQESEPPKQSNINFSGLNLSSKPAPESSLPNQNADVNKGTRFSVKKSAVKIANKLYTMAGSAWKNISSLLSPNNNTASETNPEIPTYRNIYMDNAPSTAPPDPPKDFNIKPNVPKFTIEDPTNKSFVSPLDIDVSIYNETSQNTIGELDFNLLPTRESFTVPKINFNNYDKDLFKTEKMSENISIPKDTLIKNARVNSDETQFNELGDKQESSSNEAPSTNLASTNEAEAASPIINLGASSANINAANQPIVNPGTSSKDESTNADLAANAGASSESAAAATVNSETTPANENVAAPPVVNPAISATNEITIAPVNLETSSPNIDTVPVPMPSSEVSSTSTNESGPATNLATSSANRNMAGQAQAVAPARSATTAKAVISPVHYEAVDHNLPIKEQFNYVYNTLEKINSFDDLDDSRRFFVVDFTNIIKATYNAATDTFDGADDTMNTKMNEFCFKNGIRPKVGYIVNSDENLSSVQLINRLAKTIERANNLITNISNKQNFIEDIKKIVCTKNYDSEYGDFVLSRSVAQKEHENWNLVRKFYQNNINDADMRVTYWGRNSKLTDEENIGNLIRTGNRINSLQELNDDEGIPSMSNFLTDLDHYASLIKRDPYLETFVFSNLPVTSKNIEKARNLENIYYHFVSPKIKYTRPDNFNELSLLEQVTLLSDFNKNNDKEFLILLDLDKESAIKYSKDVANVDAEYNKTLTASQENAVKRQNTNNDESQVSGTPSNTVKKYKELPLSVVPGAKNRRKRIDLLTGGTTISTNIKNNDNTSENYRGGRKGRKL